MFCYNCGCRLSEHDFCTACGADVSLYKKIMVVSNLYFNEGLEKASVRDLSGAVVSLRQSLKFNKNNIEARNLLGLVYFEMGEVVAALSEWVISKNLRPEKNIADDYISRLQSNAGRLEDINSTIKKYNQSLVYCMQDGKDLAVIQLKKVLSMNPRFIRAHQLLALLYMDSEQWEKAERELKKCIDIDRNNTQTMRYLKEVEAMLAPEESGKQLPKRKKDETVRYQSDNEVIIQPLNVKEPKGSGVSTLLNLGIGLLIGLAATYFLMVPAAQSNVRNEAQQTIATISNESDTKSSRIQELENTNSSLEEEIATLEAQVESYIGADGTLQVFETLLDAASAYLENKDIEATAADLESISSAVDLEETSEGFQKLYQTLFQEIGPQLAATYYETAYAAYTQEDFVAAIDAFNQTVFYDETNVDAWYYLGQACRRSGDSANAITAYNKVIELAPDSSRARNAQEYINTLSAQ